MTAVTAPAPLGVRVAPRPALGWTVADALSVTWRNLRSMLRTPEVIVFSSIQPIIFVLTFRYVFGGAVASPPGVDYVDFLMPGVFVQTVVFGAMNTAVGLSQDLQSGITERFRSLPMARSAVLAGRTLADLVRNLFVVLLMVGVGFLVGFRIHNGFAAFVAALGLVLLFSVVFSWVFALIGLGAKNAEAAQAASFPILALLVFASSAFVPSQTMPHWLRIYADHQPVSDTVDAVRALVLGGPLTDKVLAALAWMVGILVVFVPLSVARYRRQ
jgi:ABC-2 type transport system permease protein/oleandomycin transport system permease protein